MNLSELKLMRRAIITEVGGKGVLRRRLLDMGLTPGTAVLVRKRAPSEIRSRLSLRGYELTLRLEEAEKIHVLEAER